MKILTVHSKISIFHHENLDLLSGKAQLVIKKISTVHNKIGILYKVDIDPDQELQKIHTLCQNSLFGLKTRI